MVRTKRVWSLVGTLRTRSVLTTLVTLAALSACSEEGSSSSSGAGSSSGGSGGSCTTVATEIADVQTAGSFVASGVNGLSLLQSAGEYLYVHDYNAGNHTGITAFPKTGAILRLPKAGGAAEVFYTPADVGETITSFHVNGDDLFTYDSNRNSSKNAKIVRTSLAARTSTVMTEGVPSELLVNMFASDALSLFYTSLAKEAGKMAIYRVARSGGAPEVVTELASTFFGNVQLQGDDIWFSATQGAGPLYRVGKSAVSGMATEVSRTTCPMGLFVTSDAIVCGGILEINKFDRSMSNPQLLVKALDDGEVSPAKGVVKVLAVRDNTVFYASPVAVEKRTGLGRVSLAGGTTSVVACDHGNILGVAVEPSAVFWFEQRANARGEPEKTLAFRASL